MRISDRDRQTAHAIATLLGVELEPWQDFMLQHLLAGYREPDPPEIAVAPGPCGSTYSRGPVPPVLHCARAAGHEGRHSYGGMFWGSSDSS